jgi:hypothetical protein
MVTALELGPQNHAVDVKGTKTLQTALIVGCSIVLIFSVALVALSATAISIHTLPLQSEAMFKVKILTIVVGQSANMNALAIPAMLTTLGACAAIAATAGLVRAKDYRVYQRADA